MIDSSFCTPFLRWLGGKRKFFPELTGFFNVLDQKSGRYIEPFLGGGVFFLNVSGRLKIGGDTNVELVNCFNVVRDLPAELKQRVLLTPSCKDLYAELVASPHVGGLDGAFRFLYLNRHSFGGIWRVNKKGQFNVPYGGPRGYNGLGINNVLDLASSRLQESTILVADFRVLIAESVVGDLVFCDPVYRLSESGRVFDRYGNNVFRWADFLELVDMCFECHRRGVNVILTVPESLEIRRAIAADPTVVKIRTGGFGKTGHNYEELVYVFDSTRVSDLLS